MHFISFRIMWYIEAFYVVLLEFAFNPQGWHFSGMTLKNVRISASTVYNRLGIELILINQEDTIAQRTFIVANVIQTTKILFSFVVKIIAIPRISTVQCSVNCHQGYRQLLTFSSLGQNRFDSTLHEVSNDY